MSLRKKLMAAGLVVCMAATIIGGATLAYFTDEASKTNTFTVGNVTIALTEDKWVEGSKLMPGKEIPKNPTITIDSNSETAYTFMKVQLSKDFAELMAAYAGVKGITNPGDVIAAWFTTTAKPKVMAMNLDEGYVILGVLSPKNAGESVTYFDSITVPAEVTQDMISAAGTDYTITVTAYAIQAEGFYTEGESEAEKQESRAAAFAAMFPGETILH